MAGQAPPSFRPDAILQQARSNNAAGIRALMKAGVPVEFSNQIGQTALHVAALW